MKNILINCLITSSVICAANAFNISVTNAANSDATAVPILDNAGEAISSGSGFVASGTFSDIPTEVADIVNFTPFGTGSPAFSGGALDGLFSNNRNLPLLAATESGNPLVGQNIFVVFGDGPTLADSTAFAIFDSAQVIGTDPGAPSPDGAVAIIIDDMTLTPTNLVVGKIVEDAEVQNIPFNESIQLVTAIPEPSTSLLAGLAGLALAVRRRR